MGDLAGLLTAILLLVGVAAIPSIPLSWKLCLFAVAVLVNGVVWRAYPRVEVSLWRGSQILAAAVALLGAMLALDTGVGYLLGRHTVADTLLRTGSIGLLDLAIVGLGLFVGVPTLVRAVVTFYER
jgi:hypothetical protein